MRRLFLGVFAIALVALASQGLSASLIKFQFAQVGSDVVLTVDGAFDTTGLDGPFGGQSPAGMRSAGTGAYARVGEGGEARFWNVYFSGAITYGSGSSVVEATSATGGKAGFNLSTGRIITPNPADAFGTATWADTNLANLGIDQLGLLAVIDYGVNEQTPLGTIHVSAVPEPTALLMVGSVIGLAGLRRRRK